jgi:hypothetical protein
LLRGRRVTQLLRRFEYLQKNLDNRHIHDILG